MPYLIDMSWRKDTRLPIDTGYGRRPPGVVPSSILIHTTNSPHKNTAFADEAKYLRNSTAVSAHYLVGKAGQIAQILDPSWEAWHAGVALPPWKNDFSIGIENHVSQGEQWTDAMHDALTWLVRKLMAQYSIKQALVETHRKVALPAGRKTDPEGWPDTFFYAWRDRLDDAPPPPPPTPARFVTVGLPIYQRSTRSGPLAGHLLPGEIVTIDEPRNGHLADSRGFVDMAGLSELV